MNLEQQLTLLSLKYNKTQISVFWDYIETREKTYAKQRRVSKQKILDSLERGYQRECKTNNYNTAYTQKQ